MQCCYRARIHVCLFALTSPCAMVAAMRVRYDQFGKHMIRDLLEGRCTVVTDAEVPIETRHIDL